MKKLYLLFVALPVIFLVGCSFSNLFYQYNEWKGDNPELFTLAVNTVVGTPGFEDDTLQILEEDEYGRVLFSYLYDYAWIPSNKGFAIIIAQKSDEDYVYFQPNVYFLLAESEDDISVEMQNQLKEDNSWGQPIIEDGFEKLEIVRMKEGPSIRNYKKIIREAYWNDILHEEEDVTPDFRYYTQDEYGREIFFIYNTDSDPSNQEIVWGTPYFMILNPNGSYSKETFSIEINDIWNFQTQLASLKETNEWNQPLS